MVIGTLAVESLETVAQMLGRFSSKAIVVGIDANQDQVATHGWQSQIGIEPLNLARRVASLGVERGVYTDIQRDGILVRRNVAQTSLIARDTGLKVTASGRFSDCRLVEIESPQRPWR